MEQSLAQDPSDESLELLQMDPEALVGSMRPHYESMQGSRNERRTAIQQALFAQMGTLPRHLANEFSNVLMKISLLQPSAPLHQRQHLKQQWQTIASKLLTLPNVRELFESKPNEFEAPELNGKDSEHA